MSSFDQFFNKPKRKREQDTEINHELSFDRIIHKPKRTREHVIENNQESSFDRMMQIDHKLIKSETDSQKLNDVGYQVFYNLVSNRLSQSYQYLKTIPNQINMSWHRLSKNKRKLFIDVANNLSKDDLNLINYQLSSEQLNKILSIMSNYNLNDYPDDNVIIVNGSVDKINQMWKQSDPLLYISENFEEIANKQKYLQSRRNLLNYIVDIPPIVGVHEKEQTLGFSNGRNRFANLRDMGATTIPIIINTEDIRLFRKLGLIVN